VQSFDQSRSKSHPKRRDNTRLNRNNNNSVYSSSRTDNDSLSSFPTRSTNFSTGKKSADEEALEMGILLSQQEAQYGRNMFDSIRNEDKPAISNLRRQGFSFEDAVYKIFEQKNSNRRLVIDFYLINVLIMTIFS
jgi:hypothetical protein